MLTCVDLPTPAKGAWFLDAGRTGGAFAVPVCKVETLVLDVDNGAAVVGAGDGATVQGCKVRADWLRLDRLWRYHQDGVVLDEFPVEQSCGSAVQGLIGDDLLSDLVLTLDYPAMRLFVSEGNR